jgi:uncharacterized protein
MVGDGYGSSMDQRRTFPSGVPCWIDIEPADADEAQQFYAGLFGWTFSDAMPPGAPGFYLIAHLDGHDVGAIAPPEPVSTGAWNTYIAVDDVDATTLAADLAGATVASRPQDAGPAGRWAEIVDVTGARLRLWQAGRRLGAQIVNVPGSWNFSDLHTSDPTAARAFYDPLFGWEADELGGGVAMWRRPGYGEHLASTVDPGIVERQQAVAAPPGFQDAVAWLALLAEGEEPHWHVTFTVADRDDAVATAEKLGARVVTGPHDDEWTKSAVVRDPQGATITLSQFAPKS